MNFNIETCSNEIEEALQQKIDTKTKPLGSLGTLEKIALKVGTIQNTLTPQLNKPAILVCAGDHGITQEGISPFPQEVTFQMVMNFLGGGAAINVFTKQHNINLLVADTGVNYQFPSGTELIDNKIAPGTKNFAKEPAMTNSQCEQAIQNGASIVEKLHSKGTNIIGFGEMGIGNTTSAAALLCAFTGISASEAAGAGTGLDNKGIAHKAQVIEKALLKHGKLNTPEAILATYGGFEIATICGAMLKAAELKMIVMVDGFIVTAAFLAAKNINPNIMDYSLFCHKSNEKGHAQMLKHLKADAILDLGMRLGEGTGNAVAYPILQSAVQFLNNMSSFADAGVATEK